MPTGRKQPANTAHAYVAKKSDREVSRLFGKRGTEAVRKENRIRRLRASNFWEKWEIELLGKHPDKKIVRQTGRTLSAVKRKRRTLRMVLQNGPIKGWKDWDRKLLGKISDQELARRTERTVEAVRGMRHYLDLWKNWSAHRTASRFAGDCWVFRPFLIRDASHQITYGEA